MPESHNIWVQYIESDLGNTFQGRVPSVPVLYFSWTPQNQILQFQELLLAGKTITTFATWCKQTQQWLLRPQGQDYAVAISTKYKDLHGRADCVDGFIWVIKQTVKMHIVHVRAIVGPAHVVRDNAASDRIDCVWPVNNHVDFDTYWTVYQVTVPDSRWAGGRELMELYSVISTLYSSLPESMAPDSHGAPEYSWRCSQYSQSLRNLHILIV